MKKKKFLCLLRMIIAVLCFASVFIYRNVKAEMNVVIISQPVDQDVNYPEGASFTVKVSDPDSVESYQWIANDGASEFVLNGSSALTDTLIVPSTMQDDPTMSYQCIITGKNGETVYSDSAKLRVINPEEDKTVLYVGEYAISPGEKLYLEDTVAGKGSIDFSKDGVNITFANVVIDNSNNIYDQTLSASLGLYFVRRNSRQQEYYFHFKGENLIYNYYFNADYNSGGVTFNSFFQKGDDPNAPSIIMDGDTLTLWGGSNQIYSDGNIVLNLNGLYTVGNGDIFADGIRCCNLIIDKGVKVELNVNGTAIHTEGDLHIYEDANIEIVSNSPHVSVGPTTKSMMFIVGSMYAESCNMKMYGYAAPENFIPYNAFVASKPGILLAGEGSINLNDSLLSINMHALESEEDYAMNFCGILGSGESNAVVLENNSQLNIDIESDYIIDSYGIDVGGIIDVNSGSKIDVIIDTKGENMGIEADRTFKLSDGTVNVSVSSKSDDVTFGIVAGQMDIELNSKDHELVSKAVGGVALACDSGVHGDKEFEKEDNYKAEKINLLGKAKIVLPKSGTIDIGTIPGYGEFIRAETVYDNDMIAQNVNIGIKDNYSLIIIAGVLIMAGGLSYLFFKKKKQKID